MFVCSTGTTQQQLREWIHNQLYCTYMCVEGTVTVAVVSMPKLDAQ